MTGVQTCALPIYLEMPEEIKNLGQNMAKLKSEVDLLISQQTPVNRETLNDVLKAVRKIEEEYKEIYQSIHSNLMNIDASLGIK